MEFAMGAMSSLLPKLGGLLMEEYKLHKGLRQGIKDLMDELLIIQAALLKVSDVPLDQLDPLVKIWANDVRDLSYAIEDNLDSFMVRVEGLEPTKAQTFLGFIKKTSSEATKLKIRREIANGIKDVKIQVRKVKERYDRYKDIIGNTDARTVIDPRLLAMYKEVSDIVGIDEPMDELMKRLSETGDHPEKNLKTVSVTGFGGLGKTTLAKAVYDKISKKFDCRGFVPVGQNPNMKKVLKDIIFELDMQMYNTASTMDERQLINQLRKFLGDKRYLVVIDDIWDIPTWEMIKCALVDSNTGSRIILTTRISEVATKVGLVYNIKPLSSNNSIKLFYTRIFGVEGICPDDQSVEGFKKLLTKCGDVPLSIVTIASLLVHKPREDWPKVYGAIGFGYENNEAVNNMRKILSYSYYDLPSFLKNCLLHLSTFPEDYLIEKNQLIWRWVAEGFIPNIQGTRSFELGERYFNDLINRSMIRRIETNYIVHHVGCRVHDVVLDLIRTLSSELNFVTTQDTMQHNSCFPGTSKIARRLAIHNTPSIKHMDIGHVRSFNAIRFEGAMPSLLSFKVLRVLSLVDCDFSRGGGGLQHLGTLVQLRYLGLLNTPVAELPSEIGRDLKFLQTLVVEGTAINELPASVGELSKLMCLRASKGTRMVAEIGKLIALEELQLYSADKCPNFFIRLGQLTEVWVLVIRFDELDESAHKVLKESLGNLRKVQILKIEFDAAEWHQFGEWEDWAPPSQLHQFMMSRIVLPRRPSWMDSSCIPHLFRLHLVVEVMETRDLRILGTLPLLSLLYICCLNNLSYTVGSCEFRRLTLLKINIEVTCGEGALPMIEKMDCYARVGNEVGLARPGSMPLLQGVTYRLFRGNPSNQEVEATVIALRHAARTHPNHPRLRIHRSEDEYSYEDYYGHEDDNSIQSTNNDDGQSKDAVSSHDEAVSAMDQKSNDDDGVDRIASQVTGKRRRQ